MSALNIRISYTAIVLLGVLFMAAGLSQAADPSAWKDSALSWQKQAKDTRVVVVGVADELGKTGDKGNADVKGLIDGRGRVARSGRQEYGRRGRSHDQGRLRESHERVQHGLAVLREGRDGGPEREKHTGRFIISLQISRTD